MFLNKVQDEFYEESKQVLGVACHMVFVWYSFSAVGLSDVIFYFGSPSCILSVWFSLVLETVFTFCGRREEKKQKRQLQMFHGKFSCMHGIFSCMHGILSCMFDIFL